LFTTCICATATAQTDITDRLYLDFNVSAGGSLYADETANDYSTRSCGLLVGVRFYQHMAAFLTETADLSLINTTNSRNYYETLTLGAGMSYSFPVSKYFSVEPVLSCSSTIIKTELNYVAPKMEVRWCCRVPKTTAFYIGVGLQYILPYSKEFVSNMLVSHFTLGFKLF